MPKNLHRVIAGFALLLFVTAPAAADTQFRVKQMTRTDVPLGKGQCASIALSAGFLPRADRSGAPEACGPREDP